MLQTGSKLLVGLSRLLPCGLKLLSNTLFLSKFLLFRLLLILLLHFDLATLFEVGLSFRFCEDFKDGAGFLFGLSGFSSHVEGGLAFAGRQAVGLVLRPVDGFGKDT